MSLSYELDMIFSCSAQNVLPGDVFVGDDYFMYSLVIAAPFVSGHDAYFSVITQEGIIDEVILDNWYFVQVLRIE